MNHNISFSHKNAFSLVELSIVLVILGLLVGGVLSGQSLIRAAELRSVTSEYQRYVTAVGTFRDKYFAIPGDMSNATSFWTANGNGDGDGTIETTSTASATAAATNEISTFWRDLASAALIEGSYAYIQDTTLTPGTNNPRAKLSNAAWNVRFLATQINTDLNLFEGNYGNLLLFGSGTNALLPAEVLKPEEAWNIDTKLDDGRPGIGSIMTLERDALAAASAAGCSNGVAAATDIAAASVYALDQAGTNCTLIFKLGF